uniref:Aminotransferase-like plant mobile domain-containing protein n=1 Tax=Gossypioides kirkii TaxID=47615 RepID=B2ZAP2_9ROSI|nr:hypothetical protein [Gossypioides kirkii]
MGKPSNPKICAYLQAAGFLHASRMSGGCKLDVQLISVLVEKWRSETHIFHFLCGECTITLKDVTLQLGLPMDGPIVTGAYVVADKVSICQNLLGKIPDRCNKEAIQKYAQAYILRLIGGILILDKSRNLVHFEWMTYADSDIISCISSKMLANKRMWDVKVWMKRQRRSSQHRRRGRGRTMGSSSIPIEDTSLVSTTSLVYYIPMQILMPMQMLIPMSRQTPTYAPSLNDDTDADADLAIDEGTFLTYSVPHGYSPIVSQTPRALLFYIGGSSSQQSNEGVADTRWQARTTTKSTDEEDNNTA